VPIVVPDDTIDSDPLTAGFQPDADALPDVLDPTCVATGDANFVPLDRYVQMDRAYIQIGSKFSILMGYNSSVYGSGTTKQVMFDFDLGGGYELQLALDDPRDRWARAFPRTTGSRTSSAT